MATTTSPLEKDQQPSRTGRSCSSSASQIVFALPMRCCRRRGCPTSARTAASRRSRLKRLRHRERVNRAVAINYGPLPRTGNLRPIILALRIAARRIRDQAALVSVLPCCVSDTPHRPWYWWVRTLEILSAPHVARRVARVLAPWVFAGSNTQQAHERW